MLGLLVFLAGLCLWGGANAPLFSLWAALAPSATLGITFGMGNAVGFIGSILAPVLTGWIRDTSGSFAFGFYLSALLLVLGLVLSLAISPAFRPGNEESATRLHPNGASSPLPGNVK